MYLQLKRKKGNVKVRIWSEYRHIYNKENLLWEPKTAKKKKKKMRHFYFSYIEITDRLSVFRFCKEILNYFTCCRLCQTKELLPRRKILSSFVTVRLVLWLEKMRKEETEYFGKRQIFRGNEQEKEGNNEKRMRKKETGYFGQR